MRDSKPGAKVAVLTPSTGALERAASQSDAVVVVADVLDDVLVFAAAVARLDDEVDSTLLVLDDPVFGFVVRVALEHREHIGHDRSFAGVEDAELGADVDAASRAAEVGVEADGDVRLAPDVASAFRHRLSILFERGFNAFDHRIAFGGREAKPGVLIGEDDSRVIPDARASGRSRGRGHGGRRGYRDESRAQLRAIEGRRSMCARSGWRSAGRWLEESGAVVRGLGGSLWMTPARGSETGAAWLEDSVGVVGRLVGGGLMTGWEW